MCYFVVAVLAVVVAVEVAVSVLVTVVTECAEKWISQLLCC